MTTFSISTLPANNILGPFFTPTALSTVGQVFIAPPGFPFINTITFVYLSTDMVLPPNEVSVYLYRWNGSNPTGDPLFTQSLLINRAANPQTISFETKSVMLVPGDSYIVFLSNLGLPISNRIVAIGIANQEKYPPGNLVTSGVTTFQELFTQPWETNAFNMAFNFRFSSSKIPCLHPKTLVPLYSSSNRSIPISELRSGDKVTDVNGKPVEVVYNMCFPQTHKFIRIKRGALGPNIPNNNLLIREDHPILIDKKEVNPVDLINKIDGIHKLKVKPANVWSLCTKNRTFVMMEGVPVATWSESDVTNRKLQYVKY